MKHLMLGIVIFTATANAETVIPVQGRVFVGNTKISPSELNDEMSANNLKNFDNITGYGAEITYPIVDFLNIGFRYTHRTARQDENPSNDSTEYYADIAQDSVIFLGRVPIVRSKIFWFDAFAGAGGSNTVIKFKTVGQDGELSKKAEGAWFATPTYSFGSSFGFGYKWVFLLAELGYETNKIDDFQLNGTVNGNVKNADLSGSYFMLSLMFNGVPGTIK